MRVVLDTNTLVSAIFWKGKENAILRTCYTGKHQGFVSPHILAELEHVMADYFHVPNADITKEIKVLLAYFAVVEPKQKVDIVKGDASDNRIIECALEAVADCIVSGDKHLLGLEKYEGIRIVTSSQFLTQKP
jgi:uncharacterized protein